MSLELNRATLRDFVAGLIAILVIGALCWSALYDQSQSSQTALVGAAGAVTGYLFRAGGPVANGGTNGNGTPPVPPVPPPP